MHLPCVQDLTQEIKMNALDNIHNVVLYYWRSRVIKSFICHMIDIYGE